MRRVCWQIFEQAHSGVCMLIDPVPALRPRHLANMRDQKYKPYITYIHDVKARITLAPETVKHTCNVL